MGGTISALVTNVFGELKTKDEKEQDSKPVGPGPVRLALRSLRDTVVFGKGRRLLPAFQTDDSFDPVEPDRHSMSPSRRQSHAASVISQQAPEKVRKKKIKKMYHKHDRGGDEPRRKDERKRSSRRATTATTVNGVELYQQGQIDLQAAKDAKYERDRLAMEHKKRIMEAKGCRRHIDEYCMVVLIMVYVVVMLWSWVVWDYNKSQHATEYYDSANGVHYNLKCNVGTDKLQLWWKMNGAITMSMILLVLGIELFYWFLAPYSPGAALSTFAKTYTIGVVFSAWLALVVIWLITGSVWMWKADRHTCGKVSVDHGRGILVLQYSWLAFHFIVFTSSFDNRNAVKRVWFLDAKTETALLHYSKEDDEEEGSHYDGDSRDTEDEEEMEHMIEHPAGKSIRVIVEGEDVSRDGVCCIVPGDNEEKVFGKVSRFLNVSPSDIETITHEGQPILISYEGIVHNGLYSVTLKDDAAEPF
eukprot:Sspe_Gene.11871::Locus_4031_Transcript_1_1_Confidence_1.000_Length_1856::g.11871::m.11871